jgi:hypothetical protein
MSLEGRLNVCAEPDVTMALTLAPECPESVSTN